MDTLAGYAETLTADKVDYSKLISFLELYDRRKKKLNEDLRRIDEDIESAENLENEQKEALRLDDTYKKRTVNVMIVVLAEGDGPAELSLSYEVSGASWSPLCGLRAQIGATSTVAAGSSIGKPLGHNNSLSVHYRASITQSTGEDWNDVALDFSTASPHLDTNIPGLATYHIRIPSPPPPPPPPVMRKSGAFFGLFSRAKYQASDADDDDDDYGAGLFDDDGGGACSACLPDDSPTHSPKRMVLVESRAVKGAISTNFVINGLGTVPSDLDTYHKTEHKVKVAEFELDPKLEWIAVPKMQTSTFLRCHLKNTSSYVLLPGPTSVFMDGNFVCKSSLSLVSSGERFSTSLSIDPALRVMYHPLVKKTKHATGINFLSLQAKTDVTSFIQRVSVKNTCLTDIRLSPKDQIPISDNADYKVILIEPMLQEGKKEWTVPRNGVKARWAPANDGANEGDAADSLVAADTNAQAATNFSPSENGMIEWGYDIGPEKTVDLILAWDIAVPQGQTWAWRTSLSPHAGNRCIH
ncbi:hypothetical protein FRB96_005296 [Tulasnella sp. 330]|nr:hypothetical protein FRB96_005296 [Tulasnella sp. 330]